MHGREQSSFRSAGLWRRFLTVVFGIAIWAGALTTVGAFAQATTGTISGTISDEKEAVVGGASVTIRETKTNFTRSVSTDGQGRFSFTGVPTGAYTLTVESSGFAKYVREGITVEVNQNAVVNATLPVAGTQEVVTVVENASILNTTNSEVSTRFEAKRLSEVPLAPNGNVLNVLLSAPGVSQINSGQTGFANGISFSANGGRVRSNNFLIDGQDGNDPSVAGNTQPLNNPDLIQEVRIVTSQFAPEFGRNSGSVVNFITKSGTNNFHGSLFWFHNGNALNARSNLDKAAGRTSAPFRIENRFGGSFGGPIYRGKTFFFGTLQRWTDRALGSGFTLNGAPTEAGRQVLQSAAGTLPQVQALLANLPAAATPLNRNVTFTRNGQTFVVPVGSLTNSTSFTFDNWQWSIRVDHQFNDKHRLSGSFLFNDQNSAGTGQATPPGLTTVVPSRQQSLNLTLTSAFTPRLVNEFRAAFQRFGSTTTASDPRSESIPSIEINELGLVGFNAAASRTAIGLAVNLPQFRFNNTFQYQDNLTYTYGNHTMKFGFEAQRRQVKSFFFPTIRGRLAYSTLQNFINDSADVGATINRPLPGGSEIQYYYYTDLFMFAQDEWRIRPNFSLTYGLRYELPANTVAELFPLNDSIVAAAGGDQRYQLTPRPKSDRNNLAPRLGFNWNPRTRNDGILGRITGGDKLVVRGGYARTYDASFLNINLNVGSAFPFVAALNVPTVNSFASLPTTQFNPALINPLTLTRTTVANDFRSPYADQYSLEISREIAKDYVVRIGYVGTKGTALFQTIDANPALPRTDRAQPLVRVDNTRGIIRERANSASSIYHSLQVSLDKRLSKNFSMGLHYTWSAFIDDASEIFNQSSGEIAVPQDSFNRRADRARSGYDRPHRFTGNFVYEFPFFRDQKTVLGYLLGGWQTSAFFTFQSGAPFTPLNGADPTGALQGIDGLVGNAIRPNLNTGVDLSSLSVREIQRAGGASLFSALSGGRRVGNAGRNILRSDGINNIDLGIGKNFRLWENHRLQVRFDFFNLTNTRNWGVPDGRINSAGFLVEGATDGGNRRIVGALRYTF
jgi:hypothetical protein